MLSGASLSAACNRRPVTGREKRSIGARPGLKLKFQLLGRSTYATATAKLFSPEMLFRSHRFTFKQTNKHSRECANNQTNSNRATKQADKQSRPCIRLTPVQFAQSATRLSSRLETHQHRSPPGNACASHVPESGLRQGLPTSIHLFIGGVPLTSKVLLKSQAPVLVPARLVTLLPSHQIPTTSNHSTGTSKLGAKTIHGH